MSFSCLSFAPFFAVVIYTANMAVSFILLNVDFVLPVSLWVLSQVPKSPELFGSVCGWLFVLIRGHDELTTCSGCKPTFT